MKCGMDYSRHGRKLSPIYMSREMLIQLDNVYPNVDRMVVCVCHIFYGHVILINDD